MTVAAPVWLREARAFTFDCYGTLIDWETGILAILRPWADAHRVAADDEALLAAFGEVEHEVQAAAPGMPYSDVLRVVGDRLADRFGVPRSARHSARLAASVAEWPAFADTPAALRALQRKSLLVVVSNVDHASFAGTRPRLRVVLDDLVTAEDVGAYKPDPRLLAAALERLRAKGVAREQVVHVAQSLFHDHVPAKALGMRTVWVDRRAGRPGGATPPPPAGVQPDLTVRSLAELAELRG